MWKLRGKYIADLINGLQEEGIGIDTEDEAMLRAYLHGEVSDQDLLAQVCQFQDLTSYQRWLQHEPGILATSRHSTISVEQVMREVSAHFRRKNIFGHADKGPRFNLSQGVADLLQELCLAASVEAKSSSLGCESPL